MTAVVVVHSAAADAAADAAAAGRETGLMIAGHPTGMQHFLLNRVRLRPPIDIRWVNCGWAAAEVRLRRGVSEGWLRAMCNAMLLMMLLRICYIVQKWCSTMNSVLLIRFVLSSKLISLASFIMGFNCCIVHCASVFVCVCVSVYIYMCVCECWT